MQQSSHASSLGVFMKQKLYEIVLHVSFEETQMNNN